MTFEETKQLVNYAKSAPNWESITTFMKKTFGLTPGEAGGAYKQALEQEPDALNGLQQDGVENVLRFVYNIQDSPLWEKLSTHSQQKLLDQKLGTDAKKPVGSALEQVLAAPKVPTDESAGPPRLKKKDALQDYMEPEKPDLNQARLTIQTGRALGFDGYDVVMEVPVPAEWLKAGKKKSTDPLNDLAYETYDWIKNRTGLSLGTPSISSVDLQRQRAKGGKKIVKLTWMISDPQVAYALGVDLTKHFFHGDVKPKKEISQRFKLAEQVANESATLRKAVKDGTKPESAWKEFLNHIQQQGLNWKIAKLIKIGASMASAKYPTLFKVLAEEDAPEVELVDDNEESTDTPPEGDAPPVEDVALLTPAEKLGEISEMAEELLKFTDGDGELEAEAPVAPGSEQAIDVAFIGLDQVLNPPEESEAPPMDGEMIETPIQEGDVLELPDLDAESALAKLLKG